MRRFAYDVGDRFPGEIIVRRTDAAGANDDVRFGQRMSKRGGETRPIVADLGHMNEFDAEVDEFTSQISGVRVGQLAENEFAADGKHICAHRSSCPSEANHPPVCMPDSLITPDSRHAKEPRQFPAIRILASSSVKAMRSDCFELTAAPDARATSCAKWSARCQVAISPRRRTEPPTLVTMLDRSSLR